MSETTTGTPVVVVGVDGSPASEKALRWAADYAGLVGGGVRVVCVWHLPTGYGYAPEYAGADFEAQARLGVEETVARVLGPEPGAPVSIRVVRGHPAAVLVEESRKADLLVLGGRGLGAFTGMLLGSVSQHCTHHAACPTLVVRDV
jgi:nucleotide-binding universal stress UspA family protein